MYCNNGNNYTIILEGVSFIEPIGTCPVVTNDTRDSNYYLRTIRPTHPVFHYMPNRDLNLRDLFTNNLTKAKITKQYLPEVTLSNISESPSKLSAQIQELKMAFYILLAYSTLISITIVLYILAKSTRRYEQDTSVDRLMINEETTQNSLKTKIKKQI